MIWARAAALVATGMALCVLTYAEEPGSEFLIIQAADSDIGVLEPQGWRGQLNGENTAFCRSTESLDHASTLITVQVETKLEKKASDNFEIMIANYRERFPDLESTSLDISHFEYRSEGRLFKVPSQFYEYVVYVNPKKRGPLLLRVAMNTGDHLATQEELTAFTLVVRSLVLLSGDRR